MLILIGLGMEMKDLSVKSLEELKKASKIYLEQYTTFISGEYLDYLKDETDKEIRVIGRKELEEGAKETIKGAKTGDVIILVPGDPLIATTHHTTLWNTANRLGIKVVVYHATSIYSAAVGESGLDVYKFGPPITIPFWAAKYKPTSFLDAINKNMRNSEHTLVLLDLEQKEKRPMRIMEAAELLKTADAAKKYDIINDDLQLLVLGDIGKKTEQISYLKFKDLGKIAAPLRGKNPLNNNPLRTHLRRRRISLQIPCQIIRP